MEHRKTNFLDRICSFVFNYAGNYVPALFRAPMSFIGAEKSVFNRFLRFATLCVASVEMTVKGNLNLKGVENESQ